MIFSDLLQALVSPHARTVGLQLVPCWKTNAKSTLCFIVSTGFSITVYFWKYKRIKTIQSDKHRKNNRLLFRFRECVRAIFNIAGFTNHFYSFKIEFYNKKSVLWLDLPVIFYIIFIFYIISIRRRHSCCEPGVYRKPTVLLYNKYEFIFIFHIDAIMPLCLLLRIDFDRILIYNSFLWRLKLCALLNLRHR